MDVLLLDAHQLFALVWFQLMKSLQQEIANPLLTCPTFALVPGVNDQGQGIIVEMMIIIIV